MFCINCGDGITFGNLNRHHVERHPYLNRHKIGDLKENVDYIFTDEYEFALFTQKYYNADLTEE